MKAIQMESGARAGLTGLDVEHALMSDLLAAALGDLRRSLKRGMDADMNTWFKIGTEGYCACCLGGAVVLRGLKETPDLAEADTPHLMEDLGFVTTAAKRQLFALDAMRRGDFIGAYGAMPGPGFGPIRTGSILHRKLIRLDQMVGDAVVTLRGGWADEDPGTAGGGGAEPRPTPGPLLEFFENEVVPTMRRVGL